MTSAAQPPSSAEGQGRSRSKTLQLLGILSGFTAGAWLGAAEAPTKLVSIGISPIAISLIMVIGVFLARWSLPALVLGTSSVRADVRRAPHLILWAILAGCLWAVANTLTIFAIRDIGLSIAFPLWNSNSLLGILWGFLFFNELRQAGWRRLAGVLGARPRREFTPRSLGRSRRRNSLGNDVHSVPQGLPDRHESAFVCHFLFVRRTGHDDAPFSQFAGTGSVVAGLAQRAQRYFLADARRLRVGDWRHLPAICCKVRGHQPRHPALQLQPALGAVVGNFCFWRVARPQFFHLP